MKRSLTILGTAIVLSVGLVGCAGSPAAVEPDSVEDTTPKASVPGGEAYPPGTSVFVQSLPDGREVLCVWAIGPNSGGLSCDWDSIAEGTVEGVE